MKIVTEFPRKVRVLDPVFIPLKDGIRLAARIWLPEDAERDPVPAILEYLPYRRRDGTSERDALTHPYFAGHGYAGVRVDIRGSGDSGGTLLGEYLKQEQDDALEIIDWLAEQPWCSGTVGIIGISWGGFNGLQIAARRPAPLKAIVSICSTDDRYADDVHAMGGCLLTHKQSWSSAMFAINSTPPDPSIVGDGWRRMWMQRLAQSGFWLEEWLEHQRRDEFFKHGSVCEDYAAIEAAVYAVGGWADGYSNAVLRLLAGLTSPRKGLIGPWAHKYPHMAKPGPAIGFMQECLRWWDHWLKDVDTGIMDEPMLRCWMEDPAPPRTYYDERPGRWVSEDTWPTSRIESRRLAMNAEGLAPAAAEERPLTVCSPQTTGLTAGKWCPYGLTPDQSLDQRLEEGGSLVFDSPILSEPMEILGPPVAHLDLACDRPNGLVAVCLSEIMPDGAITRVSYGLLNLTHRDSHETPGPLEPGKRYSVRVQLNDIAHRFETGNRIRVAVSNAYWPIAWPSPEATTLTVYAGASGFELPVRPPLESDQELAPFAEPESAAPLEITTIEDGDTQWCIEIDAQTGVLSVKRAVSDGFKHVDAFDWDFAGASVQTYTIHPDDPLSARGETHWTKSFARGDWKVSSETHIVMTSTREHYRLEAEMIAYEGDEEIHSQRWEREIERDFT